MQRMDLCKALLFDFIKWGQELCLGFCYKPKAVADICQIVFHIYFSFFREQQKGWIIGAYAFPCSVILAAHSFEWPANCKKKTNTQKVVHALHLKNALHQISRYCGTKRSGAGKHCDWGPVKNVLTPLADRKGNVFWTQCRKCAFPTQHSGWTGPKGNLSAS